MSDPFRRTEEFREISDVNVVPLADVSLVLLIILLILSPMMTQSMLHIQAAGRPKDERTPPQEPLTSEADREMVLSVALTPEGVLVGDRTFRDPAEFAAYMAQELSRRTDKKVFVTPHPDVSHGQVVRMLETLKECGASSAALVQVEEAAAGAVQSGAP
jgi:biopolymer transport protein ExbD